MRLYQRVQGGIHQISCQLPRQRGMAGEQPIDDRRKDHVDRDIGVDLAAKLAARHATLKDRGYRGATVLEFRAEFRGQARVALRFRDELREYSTLRPRVEAITALPTPLRPATASSVML